MEVGDNDMSLTQFIQAEQSVLSPFATHRSYAPQQNVTRGTYRPEDSDMSFSSSVFNPEWASRRFDPDGGEEMEEEVTQNFTMAHKGLLLEDDPGWKVSEALFADFLVCFMNFREDPNPESVLRLVSDYEQLCEDQVVIMGKLIERAGAGSRFSRTVQIQQEILAEKCSWRLFRMLLEDRMGFAARGDKQAVALDDMSSDMDMLNALLDSNVKFRELKVIIEWCERNVSDQLDDSKTLEHFRSKTFLWQKTLHEMKQRRSDLREIDPDAPLRSQKGLESEDAVEENRLMAVLFGYVRSGQREKAYNLCKHIGQSWRAGIFQGSLVSHDPLLLGEDGFPGGNKNRDVWKALCWKLVENPALSQYEKATYGALSGQLSAILPVCPSWEDRLWAYSVAASEFIFHSFLKETGPDRLGRPLAELPKSAVDQADFELSEIFQEVEASDSRAVQDVDSSPYRLIQKGLMLNDLSGLIEIMHTWLAEGESTPPRHLVRFFAHLALVFRTLAGENSLALSNGIVEFYVNQLIEDGRGQEVPFYAATLPTGLQSQITASYLQGVFGPNSRHEAVLRMEKAGLNVPEVCRLAVESSIARYVAESGLNLAGDLMELEDFGVPKQPLSGFSVQEKDERLAGVIELLLFFESLGGEAVFQANAICRIFLLCERATAAQRVIGVLPADILTKLKASGDGSSGRDEVAIKEHLCITAYLEAQDAFGHWFHHYHAAQPIRGESENKKSMGGQSSAFTEKAAKEQADRQYETDRQRWSRGSEVYAEAAIKSLTTVLEFPGGWMTDEVVTEADVSAAEEDTSRGRELGALRRRCLPLVVTMLLVLYSTTERPREAVKLAELVAADGQKLYKVFSKEQTREFLRRVSDCAVAALDSGLNCVGL